MKLLLRGAMLEQGESGSEVRREMASQERSACSCAKALLTRSFMSTTWLKEHACC